MLILVYYNGRAIDEEAIKNGVRFGGPTPKSVMIKRSITLNSLKKKIHLKLRLMENQDVSLSSTKWIVIEMDEDGINCMIDAFLHFPNVTSMDVFVELETREGDVNFESGH